MATTKGGTHHTTAAEHHEKAAQHHREAAKHSDSGSHEKAGHHGHTARGHAAQAMHHGDEAAREHASFARRQVLTSDRTCGRRGALSGGRGGSLFRRRDGAPRAMTPEAAARPRAVERERFHARHAVDLAAVRPPDDVRDRLRGRRRMGARSAGHSTTTDSWQLLIGAANVVTFLMVFLIQHGQSRDTAAIQLKLDELIRVTLPARNELLNIEHLSEDELEGHRENIRKLAEDEPAETPESDSLTDPRRDPLNCDRRRRAASRPQRCCAAPLKR